MAPPRLRSIENTAEAEPASRFSNPATASTDSATMMNGWPMPRTTVDGMMTLSALSMFRLAPSQQPAAMIRKPLATMNLALVQAINFGINGASSSCTTP
ncbi:hypothetical protein D3C79_898510 [compost metagenome]